MAFWDVGTAVVTCPSFRLDGQQELQLTEEQHSSPQQRQVAVEGCVQHYVSANASQDAPCDVAYPLKAASQLLSATEQQSLLQEFILDKHASGVQTWTPHGMPSNELQPFSGDQAWHVGTLTVLDPAESQVAFPVGSSLSSGTKSTVIHAPSNAQQGWCPDGNGRVLQHASGGSERGRIGMVLQPLDDLQEFGNGTQPLQTSSKLRAAAGPDQDIVVDAQPVAQESKASIAGNEALLGFPSDPRLACKQVQMWIPGVTNNSCAMEGIAIAPSSGPLLLHASDQHHLLQSFQQESQAFTAGSLMPYEIPVASMDDNNGDSLTAWTVENEKPSCDLLPASSAPPDNSLTSCSQLPKQILCSAAGVHSNQEGQLNSSTPTSATCDLLVDGNDLHLLQMKANSLGPVHVTSGSCQLRIPDIAQGQLFSKLSAQADGAHFKDPSTKSRRRASIDERTGSVLDAHTLENRSDKPAKANVPVCKACEEDHFEHSSCKLCKSHKSKPPHPSSKEGSKKPAESNSDASCVGVGLKSKSSKYIGVSKHRRSGRWEAHIWINDYGRQVYLGGYDRPEDAACAYDVVAIKSKGLKSSTNFSIERYFVLAEWLSNQSLQEVVTNVRRISRGFSRGTSKYRGVTLHPSGRWESRIGIHGNRHIYLGLYEDQDEAARHYDHALVRLKGLKAVTNFGLNLYEKELEEHNWMQQNLKNGGNHNGPTYERWIKLGGMKIPQHSSIQQGSETQECCSNGNRWK